MHMPIPALKAVYEDVLNLPDEVQADAAELLQSFVDQHKAGWRLSPEQVAEVRRRMADPDPEYASDEEMDAFFGQILNEG